MLVLPSSPSRVGGRSPASAGGRHREGLVRAGSYQVTLDAAGDLSITPSGGRPIHIRTTIGVNEL
jgi:hypothetical protein